MAGDEFLAATYDAAMKSYGAEMAEAQSEFAQAQAAYDPIAAAEASRKINDVRLRAAEYDRMAREHVASMSAAPKPHPYGLSRDEVEHARIAGTDEETYAAGKTELHRRKLAGFYRE